MENKFAKVSAYKNNIVLDLKRKRANNTANFIGASEKCRRVDGGCVYLPPKALERYHSNFVKSGIPKRLMYYQQENGAWVDFPNHTLDLVMEKFQSKMGTVEVKSNGEWFALDFLHMIQIDLKSGLQQRIAWIDEADSCYFPENFAEFGDHLREPQGSDDIKLHLTIEINNQSTPTVKESSREFNPMAIPDTKDGAKSDDIQLHLTIEINNQNTPTVKESCQEFNPMANGIPDAKEGAKSGDNFVEVGAPREFETGHLDMETVRRLFFDGMYTPENADIIDISRNLSSTMKARSEIFSKQIDIMQKYRGDSNVQYAWLPTSSKAVCSAVMDHGLGFSIPSKAKPVFGIGTYLIPATFTEISAQYCDIDENGEQHMVLCRVILGNPELIHPGSKQFHPYSEEFDSGVDDTHFPNHYIIWNMNAATHIYPEYVVTFKVTADFEGDSEETESTDLPVADDASDYEVPEADAESESSASVVTSEEVLAARPQETAPNMAIRGPRSPWIPFPLLFDVIGNRIPGNEMDAVRRNFEIYKNGGMTRDDFVRSLRIVVGDALLRETVISCQQLYHATNGAGPVLH